MPSCSSHSAADDCCYDYNCKDDTEQNPESPPSHPAYPAFIRLWVRNNLLGQSRSSCGTVIMVSMCGHGRGL